MGFSFESPDQKEPIFDAKGIETVRRDSCPAVGKVRPVRATDLIGPGAIPSLAIMLFPPPHFANIFSSGVREISLSPVQVS